MRITTGATKLISILLILLLTGCNRCKKDEVKPIDELPAATQEGKNTFGCLVNGEAFLPEGSAFSYPKLQCFYQYIDDSFGKGYFFGLNAKNKSSNSLKGIDILTREMEIQEGKVYQLTTYGIKGAAQGTYNIGIDDKYWIKPPLTGELHITRLDEVKQIVSGTFWFDAMNDKGEKVEVREGRFDMIFTK